MQPAAQDFHGPAQNNVQLPEHDVTDGLSPVTSMREETRPLEISSPRLETVRVHPEVETLFNLPEYPPRIISLEPAEDPVSPSTSSSKTTHMPPHPYATNQSSRSNSGSSRSTSLQVGLSPNYRPRSNSQSGGSPVSPLPSATSESPNSFGSPGPSLHPAPSMSAEELEATRYRSRRNEARSRSRLHEAESNLRTAIYERGRQVPSSKHRVTQMAADIMMSDAMLISNLQTRIRKSDEQTQRLLTDVQTLRSANTTLQQENHQLQLAHQNLQRNLVAPASPQPPMSQTSDWQQAQAATYTTPIQQSSTVWPYPSYGPSA